jgi:hypothetical protein
VDDGVVRKFAWVLAVLGALACTPSALIYLNSGCGDCALFLHLHRRWGERPHVSSTLKSIASAHADFRGNDRDGDGVQQFWRGDVAGLYGVVPRGSKEPIKLVEISTAGADDRPVGPGPGMTYRNQYVEPGPKAGYWLRALRHADETPDAVSPHRWAACAFPADYPKSGRKTFIVDENNTIFARDMGRPGPPDVFPDEATLKRDWAKLD